MLKYKSFFTRMPKHGVFSFCLAALGFFLFIPLTCIQRDNLADPFVRGRNKPPQSSCAPDGIVTKNFQTAVLNTVAKAETLSVNVQRYNDTLTSDSLNLQTAIVSDIGIQSTNQIVIQTNLFIDSTNRKQLVIDSLRLKGFLDSLRMTLFTPTFGYDRAYQKLSDSLDSLWIFLNDTCPDAAIRNKIFINAQQSTIVNIHESIVATQKRNDTIASRIKRIVSSDSATNYEIGLMNKTIKSYNDSINELKRIQRYTQITTVDSLRSSLKIAKAGDTLVLLQQSFIIPSGGLTEFTNSGDSAHPIVILGDPRDGTVISTKTGVGLNQKKYFIFNNIHFTGSDNSGMKVNQSDGISFFNCSFYANGKYGIEIVDCKTIQMENCVITGNAGSGIRISTQPGSGDNFVHLTNILIVHNAGHGIDITNTPINCINLTISNNVGDGVYMNDPPLQLNILQSLVTFNRARGIWFPVSHPEKMNIFYSDIFGNDSGAVALFSGSGVVSTIDSSSYLHVNPPYADTASRSTTEPGNFSIVPGGFIDALQQQMPGPIIVGYREKQQ